MNEEGNFSGYKIEYKNQDDIWKKLPLKEVKVGVPYPKFECDILHKSGFLGYHQAMAIAWLTMANRESTYDFHITQLRVVRHIVRYSIESELDPDTEPVTISKYQDLFKRKKTDEK